MFFHLVLRVALGILIKEKLVSMIKIFWVSGMKLESLLLDILTDLRILDLSLITR